MPIYEFTCTVCDHDFERLRPISRMDDDAPCPVCDGELIEIRAKLQCSRCHTICETCCEGGRG